MAFGGPRLEKTERLVPVSQSLRVSLKKKGAQDPEQTKIELELGTGRAQDVQPLVLIVRGGGAVMSIHILAVSSEKGDVVVVGRINIYTRNFCYYKLLFNLNLFIFQNY